MFSPAGDVSPVVTNLATRANFLAPNRDGAVTSFSDKTPPHCEDRADAARLLGSRVA